MRVFEYFLPKKPERGSSVDLESTASTPDDSATTRRALLTGGAAIAGAAAVASSDRAAAAPAYLQIGTTNTATAPTTLKATAGFAAFVGITTKQNGIGIQANANVGTAAVGVHGYASQGIAVQGTSTSGTGVKGESTGSGYGVSGSGGYAAVYGSGGSYGGIFYGNNSGAYGVYANGNYLGVYGAGGTYGLYGSGTTGVYGTGSTGVNGHGSATGVYGTASSGSGKAVWGSGGQYGVFGENGVTAGVRGQSNYVGVWAQAPVYGINALSTATSGQSFGIFTEGASAGDAFALYAKGRAHVAGTLSKSAGSFKIDHPLDPEHKWLQHSFVESPDMMNVYNGNVTTDASGLALVKLPAYFGALNRDYRYQLTVIGTMAQAIVDKEIANNQFSIRTSKGRVKVSWQVTGIRHDDYAKEHPIKVEVLKRQEDLGTREFLPAGKTGRLMQLGPAR